MKILPYKQGTEAWHKARAEHFTASNAPVVMGCSPHKTRDQLLIELTTGEKPEINEFMQTIFDKGHAAERAALHGLERQTGLTFYPVCGAIDYEGLPLMASFDGLTVCETQIYEHKLWNEKKAAKMFGKEPLPEYYWQLEHQLLVSGSESAHFIMSHGDIEAEHYYWIYQSDKERRAELIAAWHQFKSDLDGYTPPPKKESKKADKINQDFLPAIQIQIEGGVKSSNLATYKDAALAFIEGINTDLQNDNDFAEAEQIVKFCSKSEKQLAEVKKAAIEQTADINDLFETIDQLAEAMRKKRLTLDKLVKSKKSEIKNEIIKKAFDELAQHQQAIRAKCGYSLPFETADFSTAIKNKKTLDSIQSAVNDHLAEMKVAANMLLDRVTPNIEHYNAVKSEYSLLFPDIANLLPLDYEVFCFTVAARIDEHDRIAEEKAAAAAIAEEAKIEQQKIRREISDENNQPVVAGDAQLKNDKAVLHSAKIVIITASNQLQDYRDSCHYTQTSNKLTAALALLDETLKLIKD